MIIYRDFNRAENDDFQLNVAKHTIKDAATPLYGNVHKKDGTTIYDIVVAWQIKPMHE